MALTHGDATAELLVKNLPKQFADGDKESFLQYFGATDVVCMGSRGKMRNSAYATFVDSSSAKQALARLHQLEVLGQRLVVEFAKAQHKHLAGQERTRLSPRHEDVEAEDELEPLEEEKEKIPKISDENVNYDKVDKVSSKFGLNHGRNPYLHYVYPPPSPTIITNIANALICVPKFYVQALHLMNRLNLPAPFGFQTPTPPFPGETQTEENVSSSEESELESDNETTRAIHEARKRPSTGKKPKQKRLRVQASQLLHPNQPKLSTSKPHAVQSVFEQAVGKPQQPNKIGMKLADTISAIFEAGPQMIVANDDEKKKGYDEAPSGFGKFAPSTQDDEIQDSDLEDETEEETGEFISLHELRKNKISREEMKSLSAFKNYSCGEPTCRLYVKNVAKQVEVKDLRHVFGRFINQDSEESKLGFDVRLMKEGRMKGQAFVSFANEKSAEKALQETHRYLLFGKPLVVQFARSAKPKS
ncbi:RNA-binding region-containing protein 3-like [Dendronephthya gigantea]|uniref:RNA-binding region-containing protein 3-like n=1 Tax=Dendronephthya gigantea TaxID=151771 RepID=UPI00106B5E76|nr:RNA-binding region-containing protein 3-like [Dendronephthya gigantea]